MLFKYNLVFLLCAFSTTGQNTEEISFPNSKDSCNVINVQCSGGQTPTTANEVRGPPGKPGKMGPRGPQGPKGMEGKKGESGKKGEPSPPVSSSVITELLFGILRVTSCQQLESDFGISKNGYYVMRAPDSSQSVYMYCDFQIYEGVTTCHQLRSKYSIIESGQYRLRLTSRSRIMELYCNLASPRATTEVWHNMMTENFINEQCEEKECYKTRPQYSISDHEIVNIVNNSTECRQYIKVRCYGMVLTFASWVAQDGEIMTYWGGATSRRPGYCACGESGTCEPNQNNVRGKCNCDNNKLLLTQDEGYLTDKSKLPVRELRFGDMGGAWETASIMLGKLECTGQA